MKLGIVVACSLAACHATTPGSVPASPRAAMAAPAHAGPPPDAPAPPALVVARADMLPPGDRPTAVDVTTSSASREHPAWQIATRTWCAGTQGKDADEWIRITFPASIELAQVRLTAPTDGVTLVLDDGRRVEVDRALSIEKDATVLSVAVGSRVSWFELHVPRPIDPTCVEFVPLVQLRDGLDPLALVPGVAPAAIDQLDPFLRRVADAIHACDASLPSLAAVPMQLSSYLRPGGPADIDLDGPALLAECRAGGLPSFSTDMPWRVDGNGVLAIGELPVEYRIVWRDGVWHLGSAIDRRRIDPDKLVTAPPEWRATIAAWLDALVPARATGTGTTKGSARSLISSVGRALWCTGPGGSLELDFPRGAAVGRLTLGKDEGDELEGVGVSVDGAPPVQATFSTSEVDAELPGAVAKKIAIHIKLKPSYKQACFREVKVAPAGQNEDEAGPSLVEPDVFDHAADLGPAVQVLTGQLCDRAALVAAYHLPFETITDRWEGRLRAACTTAECLVKRCKAKELPYIDPDALSDSGPTLSTAGTAATVSAVGADRYNTSWDLRWNGRWKIVSAEVEERTE